MKIYFDNAATTQPHEEVIKTYAHACAQFYANPNSAHAPGFAAEQELERHRASILNLLGGANHGLVFTSSGSAANTIAILGALQGTGGKYRKKRLISSLAEHSSVLAACRYLENIGHEAVYLNMDQHGSVNLQDLENSIDEYTALVSLMYVNNETGVIFDIEAIYKTVKSANPKAILHIDTVAGFGKHNLDIRFADVVTFASHKIHGPKGVGALCYAMPLEPHFSAQANAEGFGGLLQQGTPDLPAVAAFAKAAELTYANIAQNSSRVAEIKQYIIDHTRAMGGVINGGCNVSPYILNISFPGIVSETLINLLSGRGVYISAGSSCNSRKADKNILRHYGLGKDIIESSVRLSFSADNTMDEAAQFVQELGAALNMLKKFSKR